MKVSSRKSVHFPQYNWGIRKGEERELPDDKAAQKNILAHSAISEVKEAKSKKD